MFKLPKTEDIKPWALKDWESINRLQGMTLTNFAAYSMGVSPPENGEYQISFVTAYVNPEYAPSHNLTESPRVMNGKASHLLIARITKHFQERLKALQGGAEFGKLGASFGSETKYEITKLVEYAHANGWELSPQLQPQIYTAEWEMQIITDDVATLWLKKPCWSIAELALLFTGWGAPISKFAGQPLPPVFVPNGGEHMDRLSRAAMAGKLKRVGSAPGGFGMFSPADLIALAEEIDFGNWQYWKELQQKHAAVEHDDVNANIKASDELPGKMPRTETGKLTVEAAWEIECETRNKTTSDIVMTRLQQWAQAIPNNHPALIKVIPHGVVWATKKDRKEKKYMIEDCGKHLANWYKSRI